ncbi:hypothetical protein GcC1_061038, partial [Golovinomyces cichoracearum]
MPINAKACIYENNCILTTLPLPPLTTTITTGIIFTAIMSSLLSCGPPPPAAIYPDISTAFAAIQAHAKYRMPKTMVMPSSPATESPLVFSIFAIALE